MGSFERGIGMHRPKHSYTPQFQAPFSLTGALMYLGPCSFTLRIDKDIPKLIVNAIFPKIIHSDWLAEDQLLILHNDLIQTRRCLQLGPDGTHKKYMLIIVQNLHNVSGCEFLKVGVGPFE